MMDDISPLAALPHLRSDIWAKVNTLLVAKAISEFSHERLLQPVLLSHEGGWGEYRLKTEQPGIEYRFRAQVLGLDDWHLDKNSIRKQVNHVEHPLDAMALVAELRDTLGISAQNLAGYLEEVASTLYGSAFKHGRQGLTAQQLTQAGFQDVETSMMEGHPIFVANNGRIGFNVEDHRAYAPEAGSPLKLVWLAARKSLTQFACVHDFSYERLLDEELGAAVLERFAQRLSARGLSPAEFQYLPVHPWQWQNRISQLFAADLARCDLVYLGEGEDLHQPQQSIRSLFNVSKPHKHYVKTALSILNMGFHRGLSPSLGPHWAAVNDWVNKLVQEDAYLRELGFSVLREVAFIGFRHRYYEKASTLRFDPHKELLAALWRENPCAQEKPGQRLMTMAALMHLDRHGASVLTALMDSSGVDTDTWIRRYLHCYLKPLLHCFYTHHLVFTPHCENIILVLENNIPVAAIMKDIGDDIGVLNPFQPLPEHVRHLTLRVPEEVMTLSIFTDVFDCVFRFLVRILHEHRQYPEARFWQRVAECIREYEQDHPQLAEKHRRYDLFAPTFILNCLNRLQLSNHRQMIDLNAPEPVDSLKFSGTLDNPIARWRKDDDGQARAGEHHGHA
jgi:siderophore synthetase component